VQDSEIFAEQLHEQFDFSSKRYASYFFHMTENQQRSLIETQLSLPSSNEFDIDQLCDADLDIVVAGWSHSTDGDRDQFAVKMFTDLHKSIEPIEKVNKLYVDSKKFVIFHQWPLDIAIAVVH
jgi:hypothetical protein